MPDPEVPATSKGAFLEPERQKETEEEPVSGIREPAFAAALLSLVARVQRLEGALAQETRAVRGEQLRTRVEVLENEEATRRIAELEEKIGEIEPLLKECLAGRSDFAINLNADWERRAAAATSEVARAVAFINQFVDPRFGVENFGEIADAMQILKAFKI